MNILCYGHTDVAEIVKSHDGHFSNINFVPKMFNLITDINPSTQKQTKSHRI